jgi:hypothetical protein
MVDPICGMPAGSADFGAVDITGCAPSSVPTFIGSPVHLVHHVPLSTVMAVSA